MSEDGHAQERSLFTDVLKTVEANDLWIADRWLTLQDDRLSSQIVSFCLTSSRTQEEEEKTSIRPETSSCFHSSTNGEEKEVHMISNLLHRRINNQRICTNSGSEALRGLQFAKSW